MSLGVFASTIFSSYSVISVQGPAFGFMLDQFSFTSAFHIFVTSLYKIQSALDFTVHGACKLHINLV